MPARSVSSRVGDARLHQHGAARLVETVVDGADLARQHLVGAGDRRSPRPRRRRRWRLRSARAPRNRRRCWCGRRWWRSSCRSSRSCRPRPEGCRRRRRSARRWCGDRATVRRCEPRAGHSPRRVRRRVICTAVAVLELRSALTRSARLWRRRARSWRGRGRSARPRNRALASTSPAFDLLPDLTRISVRRPDE